MSTLTEWIIWLMTVAMVVVVVDGIINHIKLIIDNRKDYKIMKADLAEDIYETLLEVIKVVENSERISKDIERENKKYMQQKEIEETCSPSEIELEPITEGVFNADTINVYRLGKKEELNEELTPNQIARLLKQGYFKTLKVELSTKELAELREQGYFK